MNIKHIVLLATIVIASGTIIATGDGEAVTQQKCPSCKKPCTCK